MFWTGYCKSLPWYYAKCFWAGCSILIRCTVARQTGQVAWLTCSIHFIKFLETFSLRIARSVNSVFAACSLFIFKYVASSSCYTIVLGRSITMRACLIALIASSGRVTWHIGRSYTQLINCLFFQLHLWHAWSSGQACSALRAWIGKVCMWVRYSYKPKPDRILTQKAWKSLAENDSLI